MNSKYSLKTRREFLRSSVLGGALTWTVPAFLARTFGSLQLQAAAHRASTADRDARILVVVQMAGGNDGLNTVVPFANDDYRRARPKLGLKETGVIKLNDQLGLHTSLRGLHALYEQGLVSVVQGVGYPNPNRSHFRSTEIWQTASDANRVEKHGWIGRYFDNCCAGADPTVGVNVGRQMPQAFASKTPKGICLDNPENYRFAADSSLDSVSTDDPVGDGTMMNASSSADPDAGGSISTVHGKANQSGSPLDFLERTALDAEVSSEEIRGISKRVTNQATYPATQLANGLKLVAQLIAGGLPTRIFYVSQGGYDTHTNQAGAHSRLLQDLGDSLKAFTGDLQAQRNLDRVAIMTFSEFGRRVAENANGGTDHGAASSLFVIGAANKGGIHGRAPSLAPRDLVNGDPAYTVDFRSVYATLLERWLKTPSAPVLRGNFQQLPFV
jgi:uncharacterized protein (DUF1501 family)